MSEAATTKFRLVMARDPPPSCKDDDDQDDDAKSNARRTFQHLQELWLWGAAKTPARAAPGH